MNEYSFYKVIVYPFTKSEAQEIQNYLIAFSINKVVEIEGVKP